ncbi:Aminotriazole resistance protein [Pleurostoma richardsiae]|uniref:Aminotriazole resistance protein n=1 Tax=Pleurostoma richardsiae TaxID=41990 RepID=A0AA38RFX9_9PEZI|nr:Aminotriazole resistance protein [Pleurostoma richardsiae]
MTSTTTEMVALPRGDDCVLQSIVSGSPGSSAAAAAPEPATKIRSRVQIVAMTGMLSGVNFTNSAITGLVTVGLPAIATDLALPSTLAFWPASVSGLATASTLLLAGAASDVIGPRTVDLIGCFANGAAMMGAAAVRGGEDLVALRALQGVAMSLHFAASVAILTENLPRSRARNIAFSCLGLSQVLGFSFGLVIGGVLVDTLGWRAGWYLYGGITLLLAGVGLWALPSHGRKRTFTQVMQDMLAKVDWVGALLASAFMALSCYLLAVLSTDVYRIREPGSIVILVLGVLAAPAFAYWAHRRMRFGKPALIPNSLWKKKSFTTICATICLSFAVLNSMELFSSLFFQKIQQLSALQASLRILPSVIVGMFLNLGTGLFVDRIPAFWLVILSSFLCAGAPLLMAFYQPEWPYWTNAFVAQLLMPISGDILFTVGLIIVSDAFPEDTQSLAGAVFNTASQFGSAFGLAVVQIVSSAVAQSRENKGITSLLDGYRASYWTMFVFMILCVALPGIGLRGAGKVGVKRD